MLHFAEMLHHLRARLDKEIGRGKTHAVGIRHGFAGLYAKQNLVRSHVVVPQIMRVVGHHQRQTCFTGEPVDLGHHLAVLVETVVLQFQKEVVAAEQVGVFIGQPGCFVVAVVEDGLIDIAAQASRHRDQTFGMAGEQVLINAWFVIEAFQVGSRNQLGEILVAFQVLAEQDEVVVAVGIGAGLVSLLGYIDLTADDGVNAFRVGGVIELDRTEQVAVIGHGHGRHPLLLDNRHQLGNLAGPVEQGVVGVAV